MYSDVDAACRNLEQAVEAVIAALDAEHNAQVAHLRVFVGYTSGAARQRRGLTEEERAAVDAAAQRYERMRSALDTVEGPFEQAADVVVGMVLHFPDPPVQPPTSGEA